MLPEKDTEERVWRALADASRRQLLDILSSGPRTTGELVERLPELSRTAVMHHLDVLVQSGLLVVVRKGRERWNYLDPSPIEQVCGRWVGRHARRWARASSRLQEIVEEGDRREVCANRPRRGRRETE